MHHCAKFHENRSKCCRDIAIERFSKWRLTIIGLAESNGSLQPGLCQNVTCRLTAKNRDQLRNPTLGNQAWATLPYLI